MKIHLARPLLLLALLFALTTYHTVHTAPALQGKLKAEDVVSRHVASIGSADDLAAVKSLVAVGSSNASTRTSAVKQLVGVSQIASEGDKVLLALLFNSTSYPFEKAGYNGQNLNVPKLPDGKRSVLGEFLVTHGTPFKQGLVGGVLSTAWPLRATGPDAPKLSYSGTGEINDRKVHKLKYDPRKSGGLQITLYFDAETFQHVRTEYQYAVAARMGALPEQSVSQSESRYKLVEDFSDLRAEGKLTLPHTYKIRYTVEGQSTQMFEWTMVFSQFVFNEQIDARAFSLTTGN
jgi:hypothetical protein